jgi:hypothetical protein
MEDALLRFFIDNYSFITFSYSFVPINTHHLNGSVFSVQVHVGSSGFVCGISAVHSPLSKAVSEVYSWKLGKTYSIKDGLNAWPPMYLGHGTPDLTIFFIKI